MLNSAPISVGRVFTKHLYDASINKVKDKQFKINYISLQKENRVILLSLLLPLCAYLYIF